MKLFIRAQKLMNSTFKSMRQAEYIDSDCDYDDEQRLSRSNQSEDDLFKTDHRSLLDSDDEIPSFSLKNNAQKID